MSAGAKSSNIDRKELPAPNATDARNQKLSIRSTSTSSAPVAATTTLIRVFATVDCFLQIGNSVAIVDQSIFIPAGIICFFGVRPLDKISVIHDAPIPDGTLYIMEGSE